MICPNCKKPVIQTEHKRPKKFCNSTCRSNYWQKLARKEGRIGKKKTVIEARPMTFNELLSAAKVCPPDQVEAFKQRISEDRKLSAPQKSMIYSKLK